MSMQDDITWELDPPAGDDITFDIATPSEGGGVTVHNELSGRSAADVHPLASITGAVAALEALTNAIAAEAVARDAAITAAIDALKNLPPGTLDTLDEIAAALGDDPNFATTILGLLAGKQPVDAELTALAGLVSVADRLPYFTGPGVASLATFTSFARTLLGAADATAARAVTGAGTPSARWVGPPIDAYTSTAAVQTANLVYYYEVEALDRDLPVSTAWTEYTSVAAANWAAGIYRADTGAQVAITAPTAVPGAVGIASAALVGGPVTIPAGVGMVVAIGASVSASITWRGLGASVFYGSGGPRFGAQLGAVGLALPAVLPAQTALARRPLVTFT